VLWHDGDAPGRAVVEVRTTDRTGLLTMLTAVFERAGADIAWAKVTTLGSSVVDAFGIVLPAGGDGAIRQALERDLFAVLPAPPAPVEEAS
jgi:[protein-PII] uridylyltransferase